MNYPLPPFPIEIINEIAKNDPETFRRLVLTSERLRKNLGPALKFHCRRDISVPEILRYLRDNLSVTISLTTPIVRGKDLITIGNNRGTFTFVSRRESKIIGSSEVPDILEELLARGYQLELYSTFKILQRRISCLRLDPNFARRTLWEIFETRFRSELASLTPNNLDLILIPYGLLFTLLDISGLKRLIEELVFPFNGTNEDKLIFYGRILSNLPAFRTIILG